MQSSNWKWHLDEVFVKINGERHYLWRAVDHEGEVLESYVTKKRDKKAALKFMKKAMRRYGSPNEIVTDKFGSYGAAARELGCSAKQVTKRVAFFSELIKYSLHMNTDAWARLSDSTSGHAILDEA